jgi:hypothetical protein
MKEKNLASDRTLISRLREYVEKFNRDDKEIYPTTIPNKNAYEWMVSRIPLIDIPDKELEIVYYFRWWTFRKHIKKTPGGFIISEFLPDVEWAGKYNSISCAVGHHIAEGRWLRNEPAVDADIRYWYNESDNLNSYAHWLDYMVYELCRLRGDFSLGFENLDSMIRWYHKREETNFKTDAGLFWGLCDRDGQEFAISGDGIRLPLNCYMAANAWAIARFAHLAGRSKNAEEFEFRYGSLKTKIEERLWSEGDRFYMNVYCPSKEKDADYTRKDWRFKVRELWGYTPWYFNLAPPGREDAFDLLADPKFFYGKYGLTTAERGHPGYGCFYTGEELNAWLRSRDQEPIGPKGHECLWNGPSWPFATSIALTAIAKSNRSDKGLFYGLLKQYAEGHRFKPEKADSPYWIDEVQHPDTGDWISRTRLEKWSEAGGWDAKKGGPERGKDYNHSTFCDLVISGLFGVHASDSEILSINPRFPSDWKYAAINHVPFKRKLYSIEYHNGDVSVVQEAEMPRTAN